LKEQPILTITDLCVRFPAAGGYFEPVRDFSFSLGPDEILGLMGPSGCGKTVFCTALLGLVEPPGFVESGSMNFAPAGERRIDLRHLTGREWQRIRGKTISLIFQNPVQGFNPARNIGAHFIEAIRAHEPHTSRKDCLDRARELLDAALFSRPEIILQRYPFELSGGMCQRALIALALVHNPALLIADEPTTALDIRSEAEVLHLFSRIRETRHTAILLVSHDTRVLSRIAGRVLDFAKQMPQ
jgi:ABC-type dipeptide/oligopeptide/nickel transport system ATPase component